MEDHDNIRFDDRANKESSQLTALLKEMKEGLDTVTNKVQALTAKVKLNQLPTSDGISYLDAKYLLLLNYCSSLVYYLLRKAKGLSIESHPVVRSLVEIRLFLEKIRPIDKKLEYQIQKLTKVSVAKENASMDERDSATPQAMDDRLKYRPNPDMLVSKSDGITEDGDGIYRPPKFAPTSMEEDKMSSRKERNLLRKGKETLLRARQSDYIRELMDDMAGKPEEIKETVGLETREVARYVAKRDERERREEELFTRAPLTKKEKQREKFLKKSRYGMRGVTDSFFDEVKSLPLEGADGEQPTGFGSSSSRMRKHMKRKGRH